MKKNNLRTVDLFAGCGGLSLGFKNAGFKLVAAVDNWAPAVAVYKDNFKDHPIFNLDLSNVKKSVSALLEYNPDIIVGGPPCQDFSHAGKRNENGGRGDLTISYAQIICKIKPRFFLMENVERITKTKKLESACKLFKKAGYGLSSNVFDASLCGAPQKRKRFIMFGELGGEDEALNPVWDSMMSAKPLTVGEYFKQEKIKFETNHYYRHPRNYSRRAIFGLDEPSPTVRGVNRPVPSGYPGHHGDVSPITTKTRPLTTVERSYIQTFPPSFIFNGTKTNLEQIIGNAVPVKLAELVALGIVKHLSKSKNYEKMSGL